MFQNVLALKNTLMKEWSRSTPVIPIHFALPIPFHSADIIEPKRGH